MEEKFLGYAIVRGCNKLLIYNQIDDSWVKKPDRSLIFESLNEAQKIFNELKRFKNTSGIMKVTELEGRYFAFNKIMNNY